MAKKRQDRFLDISQVRFGKLLRESLTTEQEDLAHQIYDACGHLIYPTFEQWELRFLRNTKPQQELAHV